MFFPSLEEIQTLLRSYEEKIISSVADLEKRVFSHQCIMQDITYLRQEIISANKSLSVQAYGAGLISIIMFLCAEVIFWLSQSSVEAIGLINISRYFALFSYACLLACAGFWMKLEIVVHRNAVFIKYLNRKLNNTDYYEHSKAGLPKTGTIVQDLLMAMPIIWCWLLWNIRSFAYWGKPFAIFLIFLFVVIVGVGGTLTHRVVKCAQIVCETKISERSH